MLVATWNVNSLKARMPRVLELIDQHAPDVLLLQETKASPEQFPHLELQAAGYTAADHSGGRWAGVAVLARDAVGEVAGVRTDLAGNPVPDEARWVEATVGGVTFVSVYVINGRALDDPMFPLKLEFLEAMRARLAALAETGPTIVGGDFNIAPADVDVWDPPAFEGATHVTADERSRLAAMLDSGYVDAFRAVDPDGQGFTWWDYRAGHFHKGHGLRIDLFLVSHHLADRIETCGIDRDFRKGTKPSDHAPLLLGLAPSA
jgi:exodeoxyribonuclease-3